MRVCACVQRVVCVVEMNAHKNVAVIPVWLIWEGASVNLLKIYI